MENTVKLLDISFTYTEFDCTVIYGSNVYDSENSKDNYYNVYSNCTIIESTNPKYVVGSIIPQISVGHSIRFEHEDGTVFKV